MQALIARPEFVRFKFYGVVAISVDLFGAFGRSENGYVHGCLIDRVEAMGRKMRRSAARG